MKRILLSSFFLVFSILWISVECDICNQPKRVGPCRARLPRYYYNRVTGQCERFYYGGCRGNRNNFRTLALCETRCATQDNIYQVNPIVDVCNQPKIVGPCRARLPRYYHNRATGQCERFYYGGCRGNRNNFRTLALCEARCAAQDHIQQVNPIVDTCNQPKKVGPCRARMPRYYYNKEAGRCERFYYGGCRGNENNFRSLAMCKARCASVKPIPKPILDPCSEPKSVGRCRARIPRYYFNSASGRCEQFYWGGCGANGNNFDSIQRCILTCESRPPAQNACEQPMKIGPCEAAISRYYYNKVTGRCERFYWGGCEANENNFRTRSQCAERCKETRHSMTPTSSVCNQPKAVFIACAQSAKTRYYFNKSSGACEPFTWYGCVKNGNNFRSLSECLSECVNGNSWSMSSDK